MLNLFKSKKAEFIASPCNGIAVKLEDVNDKVFAQKLLGDGFAIQPDDDVICAPCDGKMIMVADTFHAFVIKTESGAEILIHIGLNTVNMGGEGFQVLIKPQQKVKKGDPVIKLDVSFLKKQNLDLTVMVILLNGNDFNIDIQMDAEEVQSSEKIASITKD